MQTQTKKKEAEEKVSGKKMTGAEALILALLEEGVDTVFGYIGGAIILISGLLTFTHGNGIAGSILTLSGLMVALFGELGIAYLDLLPSLQETSHDGTSLYFAHDPHWNLTGNRLAGEAVGAFLADTVLQIGATTSPRTDGARYEFSWHP